MEVLRGGVPRCRRDLFAVSAAALVGTGFAEVLRERTKKVHREAERTGFIADLIRGQATLVGYALFLRNLVPIYDALEGALAANGDPLLVPFADRRLRRSGALRADLSVVSEQAQASALPLLAEAEVYGAAITVAAADAARLTAHAYARYLGDLSGGQILKPVLARTLGLGPEALTFYDFPDFPDVAEPKSAMRRVLDTVDAASAVAACMVDEAIRAFHHNMAVASAVSAAGL